MSINAPRVLQLTAMHSACEQWRVWWPAAALKRLGYTVDYMPFDNFREIFPKVQAGDYDVVVTPRYTWTTVSVGTPSGRRKKIWLGDNWRKAVDRHNLTWVYEADDDLWSEPSVGRILEFYRYASKKTQKMWLERFTRYRQDRIRLSPYVDGFTVSTQPLKDVVSRYSEAPVHVVPNAIDVPSWEAMVAGKERTVSPVTIGWAGGIRAESDLHVLAQAWHAVAEICPEVRFIVFGQQSEILISSVPPERLIQLPWCELEEYPAQLLNFDIGCCALEPIEWNENRSCNKWYEFSMAGAASVVSPTAYGREVVHGVNGMVASTVEEWTQALVKLVNEPYRRRELAYTAQETVLAEHTLDQHARKWIDAWTNIVEYARSKRVGRETRTHTTEMAKS